MCVRVCVCAYACFRSRRTKDMVRIIATDSVLSEWGQINGFTDDRQRAQEVAAETTGITNNKGSHLPCEVLLNAAKEDGWMKTLVLAGAPLDGADSG